MVDQEFKEISLSQYRGKYVVLFFYPLDFTFVCPTEITAFSDRYADFSSKNTEVLGVSVDSQFSHLAWIQTPAIRVALATSTTPWSPTSRRRSPRLTTCSTMPKASPCVVCSSLTLMV